MPLLSFVQAWRRGQAKDEQRIACAALEGYYIVHALHCLGILVLNGYIRLKYYIYSIIN